MLSSAERERALRAVKAGLLELAIHSPFFSTLALFAELVPDEGRTQTAATDGKRIYYSDSFVLSLTRKQLLGLLVHEVLHAALLHPSRCGTREPGRWNVAADIVTNGIVRKEPWAELPQGAIVEQRLEALSVEEVYELLDGRAAPGRFADLLAPGDGPLSQKLADELAAHWQQARAQADVIAGQGSVPAGMARELGQLGAAQVDWRAELWRFVVHTQDDFDAFDRRFLHRGLYLETLSTESLSLAVAIDTSGSISHRLLTQFLSELRAITGLYPHVRGALYFADAVLDGPHDLERDPPAPKGGGGTSFVPFFAALADRSHIHPQPVTVAVYLTDGFGDFPAKAPPLSVLWVVPPGGALETTFPFGRVIRMVG